MAKYIITRGYVPEDVHDLFNAHDANSLELGWLRLAALPERQKRDPSSDPFPLIRIGIVPLGVERSESSRGPNKPEIAVRFTGVIALNNTILHVEGDHYRSGQRAGLLSATEASYSDSTRYRGLIQVENVLTEDAIAFGRSDKKLSRLEIVEKLCQETALGSDAVNFQFS